MPLENTHGTQQRASYLKKKPTVSLEKYITTASKGSQEGKAQTKQNTQQNHKSILNKFQRQTLPIH